MIFCKKLLLLEQLCIHISCFLNCHFYRFLLCKANHCFLSLADSFLNSADYSVSRYVYLFSMFPMTQKGIYSPVHEGYICCCPFTQLPILLQHLLPSRLSWISLMLYLLMSPATISPRALHSSVHKTISLTFQ